MKGLMKLLIGIGIFMFIGTAGASDANSIPFSQIIVQIIISIAFILVGYFGLKFIKIRQRVIVKAKSSKNSQYPQVA